MLLNVKTVENYFKERKNGQISIVSSIQVIEVTNSSGYGPSKEKL